MKTTFILAVLLLLAAPMRAQGKIEYRYAVSYLSASIVYIDAGRAQQIAIGDTMRIVRKETELGTVVVTAVSNHSSAAQMIVRRVPFAVGDSAVVVKPAPAEAPASSGVEKQQAPAVPQSMPQNSITAFPQTPRENLVSGRIGIQYSGISADDTRLNLSQPSALFRLDVGNVMGTGMTFSLYSRNYYDFSDYYNKYGEPSRLKNRVYEFSLQRDMPDDAFGYSFGRTTSRFVGGLGTFDGGQFYMRQNNFTAGFIYGAKVGDQTMGVDGDDRKGAVFLNYHNGTDFLHQYDGTVAYGRQLFEGRLDREFLYLQNSISFNPDLSLYESTEIELNDITNGVRKSAFVLSNTFLSVNYTPYRWLSANAGYDATRNVYLFETMKAFPDTLFDKNIMQGLRAGATVRFPYMLSLSLNGSFRTKRGDERNAHNLGATVRMSDIIGSDVSAGLRYANIVGVYTSGNDLTFDIDRTFFNALSVSGRYDHYAYTINALSRSYTTQTLTANLSLRISRALYSSLSADRVLDSTMNSYRIYAEIGIRF
jgi:hypothetical protein